VFRLLSVSCLLVSLVSAGWADTIRLKNGTAITCDRTAERGDLVEYMIGATTYYVPKSAVAGIERGGTFGVSVGTGTAAVVAPPSSAPAVSAPASSNPVRATRKLAPALPAAPRVGSVDTAALRREILNLGRVDEHALYEIEKQQNPSKSAAAYFLAAQYESEQQHPTAAVTYMQRAVEFAPNQPGFVYWYAALLLESGQYAEAATQAEHAVQLDPKSASALSLLGFAYYNSGRLEDTIGAWQHSLELQSNEVIRQYLARAQREAKAEDHFNERNSTHFVLHYEGRKPASALTGDLLRTLDRQYGELARDLGFSPEAPIAVILYTEQQFFDVTQAPSWAGALYDGKLRIPVRDVSEVSPQMERILRHELTHSFVHAAAGRCPAWLNEGLAQMEEPRSSAPFASLLGDLFRSGKAAPLHVLEGSFVRFNSAQARLAYAESLAATEYLRSNYGMSGIRRMLDQLREGEPPEAALRAVNQGGYAKLESELGSYLGGGGK
jgi:tetratricopeptide (TPR) repeat protein